MIQGRITVAKEEPGVDERGGLPSASGLSRVAACPGSHKLEAKVTTKDKSSAAAERGTRVHARMEGLEVELLPDEELVAKEMADYDDILLDCDELIREVRLWYSWKDGDRLFSGKIDVGGIDKVSGDTVLVNYKTGQGQEKVEGNWQAMAEALLFHKFYGNAGKDVVYTFNQPESPYNKVVSGRFTEKDLMVFEKKILSALFLSKADNPALYPSESACKWCRAIAICPAASWRVNDACGDDNKSLAEMAPADRANTLMRLQAAEKLVKSAWDTRKEEARDLISNNSTAIPGWNLRRGRTISKLASTEAAYRFAQEQGISDEDFFGACTMSLTKLNALVGDKQVVADALGDSITQNQSADSLVKSK